MKKYINNKVYDTETAKELVSWDNGEYDLNAVSETLYQKRTGEFFLCGEGGARTCYASPRGSGIWGSGSQIVPLDYEAARSWAEQRLDASQYDAIFGPIPEGDGGKSYVQVYLSDTALARGRRAADQRGITLSSYIEELLCGGEIFDHFEIGN